MFKLDKVDDAISQDNCVEWDSLRHLDLVLELESEFGIGFEPEEMTLLKSIDTIEQVIKTKL